MFETVLLTVTSSIFSEVKIIELATMSESSLNTNVKAGSFTRGRFVLLILSATRRALVVVLESASASVGNNQAS